MKKRLSQFNKTVIIALYVETQHKIKKVFFTLLTYNITGFSMKRYANKNKTALFLTLAFIPLIIHALNK